jgi:hypothetical protein
MQVNRQQTIAVTSIEAYEHLKASGKLSKTRLATWDALRFSGDVTAGELEDQTSVSAVGKCIWKRLGELEQQGVVVQVGNRVCTSPRSGTKARKVYRAIYGPIKDLEVLLAFDKEKKKKVLPKLVALCTEYEKLTGSSVPEEIEYLGRWLTQQVEDKRII